MYDLTLKGLLSVPSLRRYWDWAQKGGFAVLDQGLFAGTNFLVGVLLARWLEPAAYGAFSMAYSIFLFLGTLHTSLWTEPMLVYGSGRYRERFASYQKVLLSYHWRFGLLSSLLFVILSSILFALSQTELARSFIGLALAAPLILYLWLMRRGAYVFLKPRLAVYGGILYLILYLGISVGLSKLRLLNESSALVIMGISGLLAGGVIQRCLKKFSILQGELAPKRDVLTRHWEYGRWALLAGAFSWVPANIYFVVLPVVQGLQSSAALKALMNLLMPILHFNGAIASLFVPLFVRALENNSLPRKIRLLGIFLSLSSLSFWLILWLFGKDITGWLYAGKYSEYAYLLIVLGLLPLLSSWISIAGAVLRSLERIRLIATIYAFGAILGVPSSIFIGTYFGLDGVAFGVLIIYLFLFICFVWNTKQYFFEA